MTHTTNKLWTRNTQARKGYLIQTPTQLRIFTYAGNDNWWEHVVTYHDTIASPLGDGGDGYRGWRTEIWWLCTRSANEFTRRVPVTAQSASYATSEFDIAIQEVGASDFVGGRVHGKHADSSRTLTLDGSAISASETYAGYFSTLVLAEDSSLKRDSDGITELATLTKTMTWNAWKCLYTLTGTLTWKHNGADINNCYIGMAPVARNETIGAYGQITTTATQWSSATTTNVTTAGFSETINTDADVRITDPTSGVLVHGRAVSGWDKATRRFRVSNNAGSNKLYWKFVDGIIVADTSITFGLEFRIRDNR